MKPGLGALEMELRVSFRQLVAASPVEAAIGLPEKGNGPEFQSELWFSV